MLLMFSKFFSMFASLFTAGEHLAKAGEIYAREAEMTAAGHAKEWGIEREQKLRALEAKTINAEELP